MRKNVILTLSFVLLVTAATAVFPCTTAVISGKATPDGRPLLWKHRDSGNVQNALRYFTDGRYPYIGLINADDSDGEQIWMGYNAAGFAIMNSASYNLKAKSDTSRAKDREGILMKLALQKCRTLSDFEHLLDTLPRPLGVEANFGVIDAQGGAAYYETNNFGYQKLDVNDPKIAPNGYLIHTNFSFTGRLNDGAGYIRYREAEKLFDRAMATHSLTAEFLLQKVDRCLEHGLTGINLYENLPDAQQARFVCFRDFIPRYSSVSVMVVQGVHKGEAASNTVAWTILGFPLTSVALPVWVAAGADFPRFLAADARQTAALCRAALQLKAQCFPINRGSGHSYLLWPALLNRQQNGILQRILPFEKRLIALGNQEIDRFSQHGFDRKEAQNLYRRMAQLVIDFYRNEWHIDLKGTTP